MLKISVLPGKKPSCPPLTAGGLRPSLSLSLSLSLSGPSALGRRRTATFGGLRAVSQRMVCETPRHQMPPHLKPISDVDKMDSLGIEPRASRMLSGCDTTTPTAHLH